MVNLRNYDKNWIAIVAVIFGLSAVVLGAFGAHLLKTMVTPERLETWRTAMQYQMFHALLLLIIYNLTLSQNTRNLVQSAVCITAGILLFSGSLYLLVITDTSWLGIITPVGGILFILGWLALLLHFIQNHRQN